MSKIYKTIELSFDTEQDVQIFPAPEWDAIYLRYKECSEKQYSDQELLLNEESALALIKEITNMLNYIK